MPPIARTIVLPVLALATAALVSACGASTGVAEAPMSKMPMGTSSAAASSATGGMPAQGPHTDADVAFATAMIPHHRQAVQMADLAATRAGSPEVKELAAAIKAAQAPEIATMTGWLTGWGAPVPTATGMGAMGDMHSMGDGMMSDQDLQDLSARTGTAFDVAFLTGMTAHHRGAIEMARTELSDGASPQAKELAASIVESQGAEITRMTALRQQLGG